jgi:uncharacterized protein RhaS with RHS repeats
MESGMYHVRNRMYHPGIGRWTQWDPLGYVDGMDVYQYVRSQPLAKIDPYGFGVPPNWNLRNVRDLSGADRVAYETATTYMYEAYNRSAYYWDNGDRTNNLYWWGVFKEWEKVWNKRGEEQRPCYQQPQYDGCMQAAKSDNDRRVEEHDDSFVSTGQRAEEHSTANYLSPDDVGGAGYAIIGNGGIRLAEYANDAMAYAAAKSNCENQYTKRVKRSCPCPDGYKD